MKGFRVKKEPYIVRQVEPATNVLHVGCTCSPAHVERWETGTLLHKALCDRARQIGSDVVGIDIDQEAIDFVREKMPEETILHVDAHRLRDHFGDERRFDLIVAGDVIEHLPNPGLFLDSCAGVLAPEGKILITTVNAFGVVRGLKSLLFHEAVHPDHTAYYSHKTLARLLAMSHLEVVDRGYYQCEPLTVHFSINRMISNAVERTACLLWPQLAEGVVVVARMADDESRS